MIDVDLRRSPLVLYHANCADGFCAAWVAHRRFGDGAEYVPVQYGQPPPEASMGGRSIYVLDFSCNRATTLWMADVAKSLVVLDHHKTAQAELIGIERDRLTVVFDMKKSGGRLAWEHFFPDRPTPWLVEYTEDRDLWRWALPDSRAISAFLASHPFNFNLWDGFNDMWVNRGVWWGCVSQGEAILRYQEQQVERAVKNAWEITMDGYKILCVNATSLVSEIAGKLAEGRPFGATFFDLPEGRRVWSLRSREGGIDVSEIAKKHGGGGHKNAAWFTEQSR
jgi:uncharacterized protein